MTHALAQAFRNHGDVIGALATNMFQRARHKRSVEMNVQVTPPTVSPDYLIEWAHSIAEPKERLVYHYGLLMADRDFRRPYGREVNLIAMAAWDLYEGGKVKLIQRRSGDGLYHYMVEKN